MIRFTYAVKVRASMAEIIPEIATLETSLSEGVKLFGGPDILPTVTSILPLEFSYTGERLLTSKEEDEIKALITKECQKKFKFIDIEEFRLKESAPQ